MIPRGQSCCGAIDYHSGVEGPALELARRNLAAFKAAGVDAIIVNAAGCGAMLKDYAHILPAESHDDAARFVAKVKDISEFLMALGPVPPRGSVPLKVTYHDACHLCHGQQIRSQPRALLAMIPGLELVPLEETEICCGAAGTYNLCPARDVRTARPSQDGPHRGHGCQGRGHRKRGLHPSDRPQGQGTRQGHRSRPSGRSAGPSLSAAIGRYGCCASGCVPFGSPGTKRERHSSDSLDDCETMRRIVILGAGGMGTALALLFGKSRRRRAALVARSRARGRIRAAPESTRVICRGSLFPRRVTITADAALAAQGADLIVAAVPSSYLRATLARVAPGCRPRFPF